MLHLRVLIGAAALAAAACAGSLRPVGAAQTEPRVVDVSMRYRFVVQGQTRRVRFVVALPRTMRLRQEVLALRFSGAEPVSIEEQPGIKLATYDIPSPRDGLEVRIDARLRLRSFDLTTARPRQTPPTAAELARYLRPERYVESDAEPVRAELARLALGGDEVGKVRTLLEHVVRRISYDRYRSRSLGAVETLRQGKGDCTDFTDVLVALARAHGMPARHVTGFVLSSSRELPHHSWAEIYTRERGWVAVDPLWVRLGYVSADRKPPRYIHLYEERNAPVVDFYRWWSWGDPVKVAYTLVLDGRTYRDWGVVLR